MRGYKMPPLVFTPEEAVATYRRTYISRADIHLPLDFNIREHLDMAFESGAKVLMRLRFALAAAHVAHDLREIGEALEVQADGAAVVIQKIQYLGGACYFCPSCQK